MRSDARLALGAVLAMVAVANPAHADRARRRAGFAVTMGVDVGLCATSGAETGYGTAWGRGLSLGVDRGPLSVEMLFGHAYGAEHQVQELRGRDSVGTTTLWALGGRARLPLGIYETSLALGIARVGQPLLDVDGDSQTVTGLGLLLGVGGSMALVGNVSLVVDARVVWARHELPPGLPFVDARPQPDGTVTGVGRADDVGGTPLLLTAGVKLRL